MTEVIDQLFRRSSVRAYIGRDVADETVTLILNAARRAPTSSNLQAYSFVVIRDVETRQALSAIAGNQKHLVEAPIVVAVCADLHRLERICEYSGQRLAGENCEISLVALIDAALVGMCASLAADSLGLGTVMIGGLRNDPVAVARLLDLPPHVFVVFGICIGWPAKIPPPKPRLPTEAIVHWERYRDSRPDTAIPGYDRALALHSQQTGRDDGLSWSARVAKQFSKPHRAHLLEALHELGFRFR